MKSRLRIATALLPLLTGLSQAQNKRPPFTVVEATISEMQGILPMPLRVLEMNTQPSSEVPA